MKKELSEVWELLRRLPAEERDKIPDKFIAFVNENRDRDYNPQFPRNVHIKNLDLMDETIGILSLVYMGYIATPEQRREYAEILNMNEQKYNKVKDIQPLTDEEYYEMLAENEAFCEIWGPSPYKDIDLKKYRTGNAAVKETDVSPQMKKAYTEFQTVLDHMTEEDKGKIPKKLLNHIYENRDQEYKFTLLKEKALQEQNLMEETNELLSEIYVLYWAGSPEERREFFEEKNKSDQIKYGEAIRPLSDDQYHRMLAPLEEKYAKYGPIPFWDESMGRK